MSPVLLSLGNVTLAPEIDWLSSLGHQPQQTLWNPSFKGHKHNEVMDGFLLHSIQYVVVDRCCVLHTCTMGDGSWRLGRGRGYWCWESADVPFKDLFLEGHEKWSPLLRAWARRYRMRDLSQAHLNKGSRLVCTENTGERGRGASWSWFALSSHRG